MRGKVKQAQERKPARVKHCVEETENEEKEAREGARVGLVVTKLKLSG